MLKKISTLSILVLLGCACWCTNNKDNSNVQCGDDWNCDQEIIIENTMEFEEDIPGNVNIEQYNEEIPIIAQKNDSESVSSEWDRDGDAIEISDSFEEVIN